MSGPINRWVSSDNKSTRRHQELVDGINDARMLGAVGEIETHSLPGGRTMNDTRLPVVFDRRIARIITPESSTFTYTDARYRLEILRTARNDADNTSGPNPRDNIVFETETDELFPANGDDGASATPGFGDHVTAINISELNTLQSVDGTHTLTENGTIFVECFSIYSREDAQQARWYFCGPLGGAVKYIKLTADWAVGTANIVSGHPCLDVTGTTPDTSKTFKILLVTPSTAPGGTASSAPIYSPLKTNDVVAYLAIPSVSISGNVVVGIAVPTPQPPVLFGKLQADWSSGNTISIKICNADGSSVIGSAFDIAVRMPASGGAQDPNLHTGDIIAWEPFGATVSGKIGVLVGGGGIGIGVGTQQFQVYQMVTSTTPGWDWVRGHA